MIIFAVIIIAITSCAPTKLTEAQRATIHSEISEVLFTQQKSWNEANIEAFMEGYWKSPLLRFVGKSGVIEGYDAVLAGYTKAYPGKEAMGELKFEIIEIRLISPESAVLYGTFTLHRKDDMPHGYYTLLWQKIDGQWVITSDHTSSS